jgi:cysteine-rich repeat protein
MRAAWLLALVGQLAGCSKILGIGDVTLGDGGVAMDSAPPNTVIGRAYTRFITPAGTTEEPRDLSALIVRALIPDATQPSGFQVVDGVGKADGTFSISPVPDGVEYYFRLDRQYFVTTQHVLDWHIDYPMRSKQTAATAASTVNIAVTNMQPFRSNDALGLIDRLEIDSFNVMYQGDGLVGKNTDTTWTEAYNWTTQGFSVIGEVTPLPDAAQGDDLWLIHTRPEIIAMPRKHLTTRIMDVLNPAPITLANGGTVAVSGAFTPVPADRSLQLTYTRGLFDAGFDSMSQFFQSNVSVRANPAPIDFAASSTLLADVTFNDWSRLSSGTEVVQMMYGDPFPASWTRILDVVYFRVRWILLPGTTVPRSVFAVTERVQPFVNSTPNLSVTLAPPGNFKIATKPAAGGGLIAFDGVGPITASWNAVAGAKSYAVNVFRVFANGNQTRTQSNAIFFTAGTSIQLPAEVFSGSEFFVFSVQSHQTPTDYSAGLLVPNGMPNQFATFPGSMFRLSSSCGNGAVDTGEACDTTGETAGCDVDCTPVLCGDGLRNAMAGELCDSIRDSEGCDADCTLPMCGDGRRNLATEDCDDGNATDDGNGCSATCKLNNFCGNGTVQTQAEQCDTSGDSTTCDADCTYVDCPDGHLNIMAGEQCDDGNFDPNDHCTNGCMIN